eukprot:312867_1
MSVATNNKYNDNEIQCTGIVIKKGNILEMISLFVCRSETKIFGGAFHNIRCPISLKRGASSRFYNADPLSTQCKNKQWTKMIQKQMRTISKNDTDTNIQYKGIVGLVQSIHNKDKKK